MNVFKHFFKFKIVFVMGNLKNQSFFFFFNYHKASINKIYAKWQLFLFSSFLQGRITRNHQPLGRTKFRALNDL